VWPSANDTPTKKKRKTARLLAQAKDNIQGNAALRDPGTGDIL
jgi:hypothetical protein